MDLAFDEPQRILKAAARSFFQANCPISLVREVEGRSPGYSEDLWRKMADLQWLGMTYPEALGGAGGGFLDLFVLYEEMGRAIAPTPHLPTVVLGGETVLAAGSAAQQQRTLPAIARGDMLIAVAVIEPNGAYGPEGIELRAAASARQYRLDGVKLLVPNADIANTVLCMARTEGSRSAHGVTLFLVDRDTPGLSVEPLRTISGLPLFAVTLDGVVVPESAIVGEPGRGWEPFSKIALRAAVLQCAEINGALERVLEMAAGYARERVQFGRPIGTFQAVQYLCTDIAIDVATNSLLAKQAAWRIDQGLPHEREVAIAKAAASTAAHHATRQAQEVFAGIGFMMEHDIQMYTRRAKFWELNLGDATCQYEAIAQAMDL